MNEFDEALKLQVELKAEQAGVICSETTINHLMNIAKDVGAPFCQWYFFKKDGKVFAARKKTWEKCGYCGGTGKTLFNPYNDPDEQCQGCGGSGRVKSSDA